MKHRPGVVGTVLMLVALAWAVGTVHGQGSVPENGSFASSAIGWGRVGAGYTSSEGNTTLGAMQFSGGQWFRSSDMVIGTGAVVSWYHKAGCARDSAFSFKVYDFDSASFASMAFSTTTAWVNHTYDLAGFAGHHIALMWLAVNYDCAIYVDDVAVSNAWNWVQPDQRYVNGNFAGNMWGWSPSSTQHQYSGTVGHDVLGCILGWDAADALYSQEFVVTVGDMTVWTARDTWVNPSQLRIYFVDVDGVSGQTLVGSVNATTTDWVQGTVSLSSFLGRRGFFVVTQYGAQWDDLCPAGGCTSGTPTITPTPTLTPVPGVTAYPYAYGTPMPVSVNFPTPQYGVGTAVPVSINGGSPVPVVINGGSPVPIEGGNKTPVIISAGGTPLVVAQATKPPPTVVANLNNSSSAITIGGAPARSQSAGVGSLSGQIPIDTSASNGSLSGLFDVQIDEYDYSFCLPSQVTQVFGRADCFDGSIRSISSMHLLGVDLVAVFGALTAVIFIVFVLRNLQER